jgi:hypothetical protein
MDFLPKLLQGLSFLPAVVNSIETLFANRSGQEKRRRLFRLSRPLCKLGRRSRAATLWTRQSSGKACRK